MLIDRTLPSFLYAISSAEPTPGGGFAAALAGATGAALLAMVAGMPKTRTNAIVEREALDQAHTELLALQETLVQLIDRDASAYDLVVAAFRKPKATDEDKVERKAAIQDATRVATEVPVDTMRACVAAMRAGLASVAHGNPSAASDGKVGFRLLMAAALSAKDNVDINLGGLTDLALQARLKEESEQLAAQAVALHADVLG